MQIVTKRCCYYYFTLHFHIFMHTLLSKVVVDSLNAGKVWFVFLLEKKKHVGIVEYFTMTKMDEVYHSSI